MILTPRKTRFGRRQFLKGAAGLMLPAVAARAGLVVMSGSKGPAQSGGGGNTAIEQALATMSAGQISDFSMSNVVGSLFYPDGPLYSYAWRGEYDPVNKVVHFIGATHGATLISKHIYAPLDTNTWAEETGYEVNVEHTGDFSHAYGHTTHNYAGTLFHRAYNARSFWKKPYSGSWTALADQDATPSIQIAGSIEYGDYLGTAGGVAYFDGDWGIAWYDIQNNSWNLIDGSTGQMGSYHTVSALNGEDNRIYGGGGNGNTNVYRINSDGSKTAVTAAPVGLSADKGSGTGINGPVTTGGRMWLVDGSNNILEYDHTLNSGAGDWVDTGVDMPSEVEAAEARFYIPMAAIDGFLAVYGGGSSTAIKLGKAW